jgi:hypothetical protein
MLVLWQEQEGKEELSKALVEMVVEVYEVKVELDVETTVSNSTLSCGLSLVGFGTETQMVQKELNVERFWFFYGIGPKGSSALWNDLTRKQNS